MTESTTRPSHATMSGLRNKRHILRPGHDPAVRQDALRVARATLQKAGFDLEALDKLKHRNDVAIREALAKSNAAANGRAPAMRDAVARSAENWLRANKLGNAISPDTGVYSLSTADRISVTAGLTFLTENIAPWANSAEVILERTTDDVDYFDGQVTFSFSWENPGEGGLFTVSALLGVTATCDVTADSYWWPLNPTPPASRLDAYASLGITEIVAGQIIIPPYQDSQTQDIVHLVAHGDWTEGTIAGQDLFRTYVLQYSGLYVPSNGKLEFDLVCELSWLANGGGVQFIATGAGRKVTGAGVIIATQPWIITRGVAR
jgi:hypothetical protein